MHATTNPTPATPAPTGPRVDLYAAIHKGLRVLLTETLVSVGRADPERDEEWAAAREAVHVLLDACAQHLAEEDAILHRAIEARLPGATAAVAGDHAGHEESIAAIRALVRRVDAAPVRAEPLTQLYRALARFLAENLEHMAREERDLTAALWATHTDEELLALRDAIVGQIPPASMRVFQRAMFAAAHHGELVAMLSGMRLGAPPAAFQDALALARGTLPPAAFTRVAEALEVAP
jgi:hypothetical protein